MSLTIKNFKVQDTSLSSGNILQSGRRTTSYLDVILSSYTFRANLVERQAIPGTPTEISSGPFVGTAHLATSYIKIERNVGDTTQNAVVIPSSVIRLTKLAGTSSAKNMICYGWTSSASTAATSITWNVLFANANVQQVGDYLDISLPDQTYYPNLYLALILINDAWLQRTVVDETLKICSIPGNLDYFSLNPTYQNADVGQSHAIYISGYNSQIGVRSRICVAFEDWYMAQTDKDYNDVVLAIQDAYYDDNGVNDISIS